MIKKFKNRLGQPEQRGEKVRLIQTQRRATTKTNY